MRVGVAAQIAGVEEEAAPAPAPAAQASAQSAWARQLESSYGAAAAEPRGGGGGRSTSDRNTMVKVVGYNAQDASAPSSGRGGGSRHASSYDGGSDYTPGANFGYDNIAGAGCRPRMQLLQVVAPACHFATFALFAHDAAVARAGATNGNGPPLLVS
jgi:hypothetical protein